MPPTSAADALAVRGRALIAVVASLLLVSCGASATTDTITATPTVLGTDATTTIPGAVSPTTTGTRASTTTERRTTTTTAPVCADPSARGTVTVLAASSMMNAFESVRAAFLRDHPCVTELAISYGSSSVLAAQIVQGAPADVFVAASQSAMNTVTNAGMTVGAASLFARNKGAIMVAPGSSFAGRIATVADLFGGGIRTGLCVASAPCGSLANAILATARTVYSNAGLTRSNIASETPSVEDLVTKIELGEFDAGIVYLSDCRYEVPRGLGTCVDIPDNVNSTNAYLVATVSTKPVAAEFAAYVASASFTSRLQYVYGFLAP